MTIFAPDKELNNGIDYEDSIKDDGTIVDLLGAIDKRLYKKQEKSYFPLFKGLIHSYLQLIWDPQNNVIYDDCAVNAYGPNREFIPLRENVNFNLYPDSQITLVVHADWWADNMEKRLDFGSFKRILMKKYGKDHEIFAIYFQKRKTNK